MGVGLLVAGLLGLAGCSSPEPTPTPEPTVEVTASEPVTPAAGDEYTRLDEARGRAAEALNRVIARQAGDPTNAWALAHGILAGGPDFPTNDGRRAIDVLVADFLERRPDGPGFPKRRGDVRVEPHTDLILKAFVEAELPLDEPLASGAPTLRALLEASQARFEPQRVEGQSLLSEPNDAPWSIQAWCQASSRGGATEWTSVAGPVTLEEIAAAQLGTLERETMFIRSAMAAGETVQKRKQDIFGYTCGGAHLFQGAEACAAVGWPAQGNRHARIETLVELYLFRLPLETELVDATIAQYPTMSPILVNQDVKFLGHLLEGLSKAELDGLWTPTAEQRAALDQAEARLLAQILRLEAMGVYGAEAMTKLAGAEDTFQFYLDLVGDACHARKGMALRAELRTRP